MHFHILLGLKQQFSARTTEKKTRFTLLILITIFHYPSCFLQACVLLLQNNVLLPEQGTQSAQQHIIGGYLHTLWSNVAFA